MSARLPAPGVRRTGAGDTRDRPPAWGGEPVARKRPPPCEVQVTAGTPAATSTTNTTTPRDALRVLQLLDGDASAASRGRPSAVPVGLPLFAPSPASVVFAGYAPFTPAPPARVAFRNADTVPRRLRVEALDDPAFSVAGPFDARGAPAEARVAPGNEVHFLVAFTPAAGVADYAAQLVCVTEREKFALPLVGVGHRPAVAAPESVALPPTPVRGSASRTFVLRNTGAADAEVALAVVAPPGDGGDADGTAPSPFTLDPPRCTVKPGEAVAVTATFAPASAGRHTAVATFTELTYGGSGAIGGQPPLRVALAGDGVELPVALSSASVALPPAYVTTASSATLALTNPTDQPVAFTWCAHADEAADVAARRAHTDDLRQQWAAERRALLPGSAATADELDAALAEDEEAGSAQRLLLHVRDGLAALRARYTAALAGAARATGPQPFASDAFALTPASGSLWTQSTLEFVASFTPPRDDAFSAVAYLQVTGRVGRLPVALTGRGVGPLLALAYDAVDVGPVTATSVHRYEVQLVNKGEIPAAWAIAPEGGGGGGGGIASCFMFEPPRGTLGPGESALVSAYFSCARTGAFRQAFCMDVNGAAPGKAPTLTFTGTVTPPSFHVDAGGALDFGVVPFGFEQRRQFAVYNTSAVPFTFRWRVVRGSGSGGDYVATATTATSAPAAAAGTAGALQDACDALALAARQHAGPELALHPAGPQRLQPGQSLTLTACLTPRLAACGGAAPPGAPTPHHPLRTALVMDVDEGGARGLAELPVTAQVAVPRVRPAARLLDAGRLFVGHPSPLHALLTLVNDDDVPARYTLLPQEPRTTAVAALGYPAPTGVVPPRGAVTVPLVATCHRTGPLSLPVGVHVDGDATGPLLLELAAVGTGPCVAFDGVDVHAGLDFGRLRCLAPATRQVTLVNASPIPAAVALRFGRGRASRYSVAPPTAVMPPGGSLTADVTACLDDCVPFPDALLVDVEGSSDGDGAAPLALPLAAVGTGPTVTCAEVADLVGGPLPFGPAFTHTPVARTLTLTNRGARALTLQWINASHRARLAEAEAARKAALRRAATAPRAGGATTDAAAAAVPPPVFRVEPAHAHLPPGGTWTVTVVGVAATAGSGGAGDVEELLQLLAKPEGEVRHATAATLTVGATFVHPRLELQPPRLAFLYEHAPGDDDDVGDDSAAQQALQTRTVTLTNPSPLPLEVVASCTGAALSLGSYDFTVPPGASLPLEVSFDPHFRDDRQSIAVDARVTLSYGTTISPIGGGGAARHLRDVLPVAAEARFPNVRLDATSLDFGCVLTDTTARQVVTVTNTSALPVRLAWSFVEDEAAAAAAAAAAGQRYIPVNQAFDILPITAQLAPGEALRVTVSYYAHAGREFSVVALCEVAGGPEYELALAGRSGAAIASVDTEPVLFGCVPFDASASRTLTLSNPGKVDYGFSVAVNAPSRAGVFTVSPAAGRIAAGDKASVLVTAAPGLPLPASCELVVTLAHFPPYRVPVAVEGTFACVAVELPREEDVLAAAAAGGGPPPSLARRGRRGSLASVGRRGSVGSVFSDPAAARRGSASSLVSATGGGRRPSQSGGAYQLLPGEVEAQAKAASDALIASLQQLLLQPQQQDGVGSGSSDDSQLQLLPPSSTASSAGLLRRRSSSAGGATTSVGGAPSCGRFVLDFGCVPAGTSTRPREVGFLNAGQGLVAALSLATRAAAAQGFAFAPAAHKAVPVGGRVAVAMTFTAPTSTQLARRAGGGAPASSAADVRVEVPLHVKGGPGAVLVLTAHVGVPTIAITTGDAAPTGSDGAVVDFGAVGVGHQRRVALQLHNTARVPAAWALGPPSGIAAKGRDKAAFAVEPAAGLLAPGERVAVNAVFTPGETRDYAVALPVKVVHNDAEGELRLAGAGADVKLQLAVEGAAPGGSNVCDLGPILPGVPPAVRIVTLTNASSAPVEVFCAELDPQHADEVAALLAAHADGRCERGGLLRLPLRAPGEPLVLLPSADVASDAAGVAAAPGTDALAPPNAPRAQGRAVDVVVVGAPGIGATSLAGALASTAFRGEAPVLKLDETVRWAAAGRGGPALAARVLQHLPGLASATADGSETSAAVPAAEDAGCAALLALPSPVARPSTPAASTAVKSGAASRRPAPLPAAPQQPVKGGIASTAADQQPPGRLPWWVLRDALRARLACADCGAAAVIDGVDCSYNGSVVDAVRALKQALQGDGGGSTVDTAPTPASTLPPPGKVTVVTLEAPPFVGWSERLVTAAAETTQRLRETAALLAAEGSNGSDADVTAALRRTRRQLMTALARLRQLCDGVDAAGYDAAAKTAQQVGWALSGLTSLPPAASSLPTTTADGGRYLDGGKSTPAAPTPTKQVGSAAGGGARKEAPRPSSSASGKRTGALPPPQPVESLPAALPDDVPPEVTAAAAEVTVDASLPVEAAAAAAAARLPPLPEHSTPFNMDLPLPQPVTHVLAPMPAAPVPPPDVLLRNFRVAAPPASPTPQLEGSGSAPADAEAGFGGGVPAAKASTAAGKPSPAAAAAPTPAQRRGSAAQAGGKAAPLPSSPRASTPASPLPASPSLTPDFPPQPTAPARWVLQPGASTTLQVSFVSSTAGEFTGALTFGVVGSRRTWELPVRGVAARPEVTLQPAEQAPAASAATKRLTATLARTRTAAGAGRVNATTGVLEFGPLAVGRTREGATAEQLRGRHSATYRVTNTGLLPTTVCLSLLSAADTVVPWHASAGASSAPPLLADAMAAAAATVTTAAGDSPPLSAPTITLAAPPAAAAPSKPTAGRPPTAGGGRASSTKSLESGSGAAAPPPPSLPLQSALLVEPTRIEALAPGDTALVTVWALPPAAAAAVAVVPPSTGGTPAPDGADTTAAPVLLPVGHLRWNALVARVADSPQVAACAVTCVGTGVAASLRGPWESAITDGSGSAASSASADTAVTALPPSVAAGKAGSKLAASPQAPLPAAATAEPQRVLTFSRQRAGAASTQRVTLRSDSLIPLVWRLAPSPPALVSSPPAFTVTPTAGTLPPGSEVAVEVRFATPGDASATATAADSDRMHEIAVAFEVADAAVGFAAAAVATASTAAPSASAAKARPAPLPSSGRKPNTSSPSPSVGSGSSGAECPVVVMPPAAAPAVTSPAQLVSLPLVLRGESYRLLPVVTLLPTDAGADAEAAPAAAAATGKKGAAAAATAAAAPPAARSRSGSIAKPSPAAASGGAAAVGSPLSLPSSPGPLPPLPAVAAFDFGKLRVHEVASQTLQLRNAGRHPFLFRVTPQPSSTSSAAAGAEPLLTVTPPSGAVVPGEAVSLTVTLTSAAEVRVTAAQLATLAIVDDVGGVVVHSLPLTATATSCFSRYALAPARSLHFGPVKAGDTKARTLELTNTGAFPFDWRLLAAGSAEDAAALEVTMGRAAAASPLPTPTPPPAPSPSIAPAAAKPPPAAGGGGKGKAAAAAAAAADAPVPAPPAAPSPSATFGAFTLQPCCGLLLAPGDKAVVTVTFAPGGSEAGTAAGAAGGGTVTVPLRLHVGGYDHVSAAASSSGGSSGGSGDGSDALLYHLVGEAWLPSLGALVADPRAVFEEHPVVETLAQLGLTGPHQSYAASSAVPSLLSASGALTGPDGAPLPSLFSRTRSGYAAGDNTFSFGQVHLHRAHSGNRGKGAVTERLRVSNPGKLPLTVLVAVEEDGSSDGAATPAGDSPAGSASPQLSSPPPSAFSVPFPSLTILPYESAYLPVSFAPTGLRTHTGVLTLTADGAAAGDASAAFSVRLHGVGTLPSVTIAVPVAASLPPAADAGGSAVTAADRTLHFPRTPVGGRRGGSLALRNNGVLPAVTHASLPVAGAFRFGAAAPRHLLRPSADGIAVVLSQTVLPGAEVVVPVEFAPSLAAHQATAAAAFEQSASTTASGGSSCVPHAGELTVSVGDNPFSTERVALAGASHAADVVVRLPAAESADTDGDVLGFGALSASALAAAPASRTFEVVNVCPRPVRFEWPAAVAAGGATVTLTPRVGHLPPGGHKVVTATLSMSAGTAGTSDGGAPVPLPQPLTLDVTAVARVARVTYALEFAGTQHPREDSPTPQAASAPASAASATSAAPAPESRATAGNKSVKPAAKPGTAGGKPGEVASAGASKQQSAQPQLLPPPQRRRSVIKQTLRAPPSEPTVTWDSGAVTTARLTLGDPAADAALGDGSGSLAPDGVHVDVSGVLVPELAYAVVDDALPVGDDGSVAVAACERALPDGGVVARPGPEEAAATELVPLRLTACADVPRFTFRRTGAGAPPADAVASGGVDPTAVAFAPTFLFQARTVGFTLTNDAVTPLAYEWEVTEAATGADAGDTAHLGADLTVTPSAGAIPPGGSQAFIATFQPTRAGRQAWAAELLVLRPDGGAEVDASAPPLRLAVEGTGLRPLCHFDVEASDYLTARRPAAAGPVPLVAPLAQQQPPPVPRVVEATAVGGASTATRRFTVLNTSHAPLEYEWTAGDSGGHASGGQPRSVGGVLGEALTARGAAGGSFTVVPATGVIPPGWRHEMAVEYTLPPDSASTAAVRVHSLPPDVDECPLSFTLLTAAPSSSLPPPTPFLLVATVAQPRVRLDREAVAFPPALLGAHHAATLRLASDEAAPVAFEVASVTDDDGQPLPAHVLAVEPAFGTVPPAGSGAAGTGGGALLELRLAPAAERAYNATVAIAVAGAREPLRVNVKGSGYTLKDAVTLLPVGAADAPSSTLSSPSALPFRLLLQPSAAPPPLPLDATLMLGSRRGSLGATRTTHAGTAAATAALNVVDFGDVQVNDSGARRLTVTNGGTLPLTFQWTPVMAAAAAAAGSGTSRSLTGTRRGSSGSLITTTATPAASSDAFSRAFRITPDAGRVLPGETVVCEVAFTPLAPAPPSSRASVACVISGVKRYDLALAASASRPALEFSTFALDFGECFAPPPSQALSAVAPVTAGGGGYCTCVLTLTSHESERDISVSEVVAEDDGGSRRAFDVNLMAAVIKPGQRLEVPVTFRPAQPGAASSTAVFEVNGLHRVTMGLTGTGVPLALEVVSPPGGAGSVLTLGAVHLGDGAAQTLRLANRSKRHVLLELGDDDSDGGNDGGGTTLAARGITIVPCRLLLPPQGAASVEVRYAPLARAPPFAHPLRYRCALAAADGGALTGFSDGAPLVTLSGSCVGASMRLECESLALGPVCAGSSATRHLLLINDGDVATDWRLDHATLPPEFAVAPTTGRLRPQTSTPLAVTFTPAGVGGTLPPEGVPVAADRVAVLCMPAGSGAGADAAPPTRLTVALSGVVVPRPAAAGVPVAFTCRVRESATQGLPLPANPSDAPLTLSPVISHPFWSGPRGVTLPPRAPAGSVAYPLTYRPLAMTTTTAAAAQPHAGTVFFLLPGGAGLSFDVSGTATPPAPAPPVSVALPARARHVVSLPVTNWLPTAQTLAVAWAPSSSSSSADGSGSLPPTVQLSGPPLLELPPGGSRAYKLAFTDQREGGVTAVDVTFTAAATGEYVVVPVVVTSTRAALAGAVALRTHVRVPTAHVITIDHSPQQLQRGAAVTWEPPVCAHPAVRVTHLLQDAGATCGSRAAQSRFRVEFRPLAVTSPAAPPATLEAAAAAATASPAAPPPTSAPPSRPGSASASSSRTATAAAGKGAAAGGKNGGKAATAAAAKPAAAEPAATVIEPKTDALAAFAASPSAELLLRSPQLGEHVYRLDLVAEPPARPEPRVDFTAPLGSACRRQVHFRHHSTQPRTYAVAVTAAPGAAAGAFTAPATVTVPGAADEAAAWAGVPAAVDVTFEGTDVGATAAAELVITAADSSGGGAVAPLAPFVVPLAGTTTPPQPAGPFAVAPDRPAAVSFRNVWGEEREFALSLDPPGLFSLQLPGGLLAASGTLRIPPKSGVTVGVRLCGCGGDIAPASRTGRLTIACAGGSSLPPWVFYLQAEPAPAGGVAAAATAPAPPAPAAGGGKSALPAAAAKSAGKR